MNKLSEFFYTKSSLVLALVTTAISFGFLFVVMMDASKCFEVADSDVQSLGTTFGLTAETVQRFFSARTADMIDCYRSFNLISDNVFAATYGLMYVAWLSLIFRPFAERAKWLNLVPLIQMVFDWLENVQMAQLAGSALAGEAFSATNVQLASAFSMVKWVSSGTVFVLILIGVGIRVAVAVRGDRT